ncbi:putative MPP superfamily phosphohydrolase/membrane protein implicated in regulation of membrane protease activity [Streptomyces sp. SAI-133]|uniref:metallophosphoesterase n=1 Tax=unclassified Streptomyces TaxID=2593676 RepID=UPI00247607A6|nr:MULTISPECIES: metallophosphoesterase [unclassified Streptomyces]MDH6549185.1 putative MPP superfamily phosphohydrolase/membrane protein implicated in regulation of membrane protease activity [Streptomyces sp. SAI-041]MDH6586799.1 putative MPP superfamily phosphohydrolase/membrane protein implicated in regulation of membrane protease activity [Streptomyces sp. SAI-133]
MVILFALLALTVLVTANWYLWRRLFRDTTGGPGRTRHVGAVLIGGGWILAIAALVAERTGAPFWLQRVLAWPGFLWLALSMYLLLAVVAGELVRPVLRRLLERRDRGAEPAVTAVAHPERVPAGVPAEKPVGGGSGPGEPRKPQQGATASEEPRQDGWASEEPRQGGWASEEPRQGGSASERRREPQRGKTASGEPRESGASTLAAAPSRRLFVSRVVAGAAAAAAVGTVGYGTYGVLRGPRVKRVTVPLAKLPRAAHGYRIAVVSDIHLSPVLGRGFAQKVVDTINSTRPDLIAVVGDLVDGSVQNLGPAAAPLAGLEARHGSFFVTGNHEYFSGAEQWVEEVRRLGLRPLENDRTELAWFDLAGVNDIAGESEGQGPDFAKALGDRDPARACVLLAHQPVQIHDAVDHGVDLQLSGHTHGGQLWPGNLLAEAANPTVAGLERYGDTQLYVSRGAGAWGPPTRVGAPSDITVIELASKRA